MPPRRVLAFASIYDSDSQPDAARVGSVQIDRVMRFNAHGPQGLINGKAPGLPSRLNNHQHENWLSNRINTRPHLSRVEHPGGRTNIDRSAPEYAGAGSHQLPVRLFMPAGVAAALTVSQGDLNCLGRRVISSSS